MGRNVKGNLAVQVRDAAGYVNV